MIKTYVVIWCRLEAGAVVMFENKIYILLGFLFENTVLY